MGHIYEKYANQAARLSGIWQSVPTGKVNNYLTPFVLYPLVPGQSFTSLA